MVCLPKDRVPQLLTSSLVDQSFHQQVVLPMVFLVPTIPGALRFLVVAVELDLDALPDGVGVRHDQRVRNGVLHSVSFLVRPEV